jgi:hypothetical protein
MILRYRDLNQQQQAAFRAAVTYLSGRLRERATIEWALHLRPVDVIARAAAIDVVDSPDGGGRNGLEHRCVVGS